MANLDLITAVDVLNASRMMDIDAAVSHLQVISGIETGDVADLCLGSHREAWVAYTEEKRFTLLMQWLRSEENF
jgi:hypothetical protein